jgi:hypothetical protein
LLVLPGSVYKWSIHLFTNPHPVESLLKVIILSFLHVTFVAKEQQIEAYLLRENEV